MGIKGSKQETSSVDIVINGHGLRLDDKIKLNNPLVLAGDTNTSYEISVDSGYHLEKDLRQGKIRPIKYSSWYVYQEDEMVYNIEISPWRDSELETFATKISTDTKIWSDIDGAEGLLLDRDPNALLFIRHQSTQQTERLDASKAKDYFIDIDQKQGSDAQSSIALFAYFPNFRKVKVFSTTYLNEISNLLEQVVPNFNLVCVACHGIHGASSTAEYKLDTKSPLLNFDELLSLPRPSLPEVIDHGPKYPPLTFSGGAGAEASAPVSDYSTSTPLTGEPWAEPHVATPMGHALVVSKPEPIEIASKATMPTFIINAIYTPQASHALFRLENQILLSPESLDIRFKIEQSPEAQQQVEQTIHYGELPWPRTDLTQWQVNFANAYIPNVKMLPEAKYSDNQVAATIINDPKFLSHLVTYEGTYLDFDQEAFLVLRVGNDIICNDHRTSSSLINAMADGRYDARVGYPIALICPRASQAIVLGFTSMEELCKGIAHYKPYTIDDKDGQDEIGEKPLGAHIVFMASADDRDKSHPIKAINFDLDKPTFVTQEVIREAYQGNATTHELELAFTNSQPSFILNNLYGLKPTRQNEYELGPMVKTQATYDFEHMIYLMLISPSLVNFNSRTQWVEFSGVSYELPQLIKLVDFSQINLSHMSFLFEQYVLHQGIPFYKYTQSSSKSGKLSKRLLRSKADFELEPDSALNQLSLGELWAINYYTQSEHPDRAEPSYYYINLLLNSPEKAITEMLVYPQYMQTILLMTGFLSSALNNAPHISEKSTVVYRSEGELPTQLYQTRSQSSKFGDIMITNRFLSTSTTGKAAEGVFKGDDMAKVFIVNPLGLPISGASVYEKEREFLIPPSAMVFDLVYDNTDDIDDDGCVYYIAHSINTPSTQAGHAGPGLPWFISHSLPELEALIMSYRRQADRGSPQDTLIQQMLEAIVHNRRLVTEEMQLVLIVSEILARFSHDLKQVCPELYDEILIFVEDSPHFASLDYTKLNDVLEKEPVAEVVSAIILFSERALLSHNRNRQVLDDENNPLTNHELEACIAALKEMESWIIEDKALSHPQILAKILVRANEDKALAKLPSTMLSSIRRKCELARVKLNPEKQLAQLLLRLKLDLVDDLHSEIFKLLEGVAVVDRLSFLLKIIEPNGCLLDYMCFKQAHPSWEGDKMEIFYRKSQALLEQIHRDSGQSRDDRDTLYYHLHVNIVVNLVPSDLMKFAGFFPNFHLTCPMFWLTTTPELTLADILRKQPEKAAIYRRIEEQRYFNPEGLVRCSPSMYLQYARATGSAALAAAASPAKTHGLPPPVQDEDKDNISERLARIKL